MNSDDFNQLIAYRRSVFPRDYTGAQVDESIVKQILENANLAPTHKLTEPWRFVVFTGSGIHKLAAFQADCYKKVTERDGSFKPERYEGLLSKPPQSSHIISIGMKRDPRAAVPELEEVGAVFCAVENMYLTAAAYGIGCYLSTGGITYFPEALEFFGLERADKLLGFLHLGVPKTWPRASRRKPLEEKVRWAKD